MHLIDEEGQITTREINIVVSRESGEYTAIKLSTVGDQKKILIDLCVSYVDMQKKMVWVMKKIMTRDKNQRRFYSPSYF